VEGRAAQGGTHGGLLRRAGGTGYRVRAGLDSESALPCPRRTRILSLAVLTGALGTRRVVTRVTSGTSSTGFGLCSVLQRRTMSDHTADTPSGHARGHGFGADLQRTLRAFYRAGGIDIRFDRFGRVSSVRLVPEAQRSRGTHEPGHHGSCSDRVTWTACPRCGGRAAAGWVRVAGAEREPVERLVEFDCTAGCRPSPVELRLVGPV
jgi:hypothetical protein